MTQLSTHMLAANWEGPQITYHHRPIVPPECPQAMAMVALGSGANWLGYYMYHGGSQPVGKHSYFNEYTVPRISYDFQAPVTRIWAVKRILPPFENIASFLAGF